MDARAPLAVGAAVDAALAPLREEKRTSKSKETKSEGEGEENETASSASASAALEFISAALSDARNAPVAAAGASLAAALVSPHARLRRAALRSLDEKEREKEKRGGSDGTAAAPSTPAPLPTVVDASLAQTLLDRISDDDPSVAADAVSWRGVRSLPRDAAAAALARAARTGDANSGAVGRRALRSLCRLAREMAADGGAPEWKVAAVAEVVAAALPLPGRRKAARAAAEAGAEGRGRARRGA